MRSTSGSTRSTAQRGFTMVELVTVIVVLGILAAVAAPRLLDNAVFTERGYADEIAGALRYSQRIAQASNCNVRFIVNAAGYSAVQPDTFCVTGGPWNRVVQFADRTALVRAAPAGIVVNAAVIEFNGQAPPALPVVGPAAALNVGRFVVAVNQASGAVTVQ